MLEDAAFKSNMSGANQADNFPVTTGASQRLSVQPGSLVRIANSTVNPVNVNFGTVLVGATANDMIILGNTVEVLQVPFEATFIAVFSAIASTISITRGT
jgi:hypothetical protein